MPDNELEDIENAIIDLRLAARHLSEGSTETVHYLQLAFYALRRLCNSTSIETQHQVCASAVRVRKMYDTLRDKYAEDIEIKRGEVQEIMGNILDTVKTLHTVLTEIMLK